MCGTKQSVLKVFFSSTSAAECRPIVQDLNMRRGAAADAKVAAAAERTDRLASLSPSTLAPSQATQPTSGSAGASIKQSRWSLYVDNNSIHHDQNSDNDLTSNLSFVHPSEKGGRPSVAGNSRKTRPASDQQDEEQHTRKRLQQSSVIVKKSNNQLPTQQRFQSHQQQKTAGGMPTRVASQSILNAPSAFTNNLQQNLQQNDALGRDQETLL
ncbi:UNVERIFIED_CONTAM: hypothetical protein HDU68_010547 [Siphonaria sp. JEL0065]|nr:hypothetical protein HDU68_010547 [Siphonaria sp. JEL0065]